MKANTTIILTALCFATPALSSTDVIIYGDDAYPPYAFTEGGEMAGIYTEVLTEIFTKMPDYSISLEGTPWQRGLAQIERGQIFALYPPYARPQQRPFMEYNLPILDEKLVVVCQADVLSSPRPQWPDDYTGLIIGNNSGFAAGGDAFKAAVAAGEIKLDETKGTENNLLKLIAGRTDCYMNDGLSIQWELKKLENAGQYDGVSIVEGATISQEQGYLGFVTDGSNFAFKDDFKNQYLTILQELKDTGEIDKIVQEYIASFQ